MYNPVTNNWQELYPGAREELLPDMPTPKMKPLTILVYFDASYAPCLLTRRSVTGIIELLFDARRSAKILWKHPPMEQKDGCRSPMCRTMLGVTVTDASVMLGNNQSTIGSCTIPSSGLKKKHNAIA